MSKPGSRDNSGVRIEPTADQATLLSLKEQLKKGYGNVYTKYSDNMRYITVGDYANANSMKTIKV